MISISSLFLKSSLFRKSLIPNLKAHYFHELGLSIPLGKGYSAPMLENDYYNSFSEIFIDQEYGDFLPTDNLHKIIDIGAHYGYFSLWLQNKFQKQELNSIMIEASSLCERSLEQLCIMDRIKGRFQYLKRAIGDPQQEMMKFFDRPFMASSKFDSSDFARSNTIKILKSPEVFEALPPPYDLIKCDIEGSEWEFIANYSEILKVSKNLILEWHSWHSGGSGYNQIIEALESLDFKINKSSPPLPAVGMEGEVGLLLAENKSYLN